MTDTFDPASDVDSGVSSSDANPSASPTVDYQKKYNGLNAAYAKLQAERDALKKQLDSATVNTESELANARKSVSDFEARFKDLETKYGSLVSEKASLEGKVTKYESDANARKLIANEFPQLRDLADKNYLKSLTDFESEETYKSYLSEMAASIKGGVRTAPTPNVGATSRQSPKPARTKEEVFADFDKLSLRDPQYEAKHSALEEELEQIRLGS